MLKFLETLFIKLLSRTPDNIVYWDHSPSVPNTKHCHAESTKVMLSGSALETFELNVNEQTSLAVTVNKWLCLNSWITVTPMLFPLPQSGTRLLDYFMVSVPVLAEGVTLATENLNSACTPDKPVLMYTITLSPQQLSSRSLGHYIVKYHSNFRPCIHSQKIWKSERS